MTSSQHVYEGRAAQRSSLSDADHVVFFKHESVAVNIDLALADDPATAQKSQYEALRDALTTKQKQNQSHPTGLDVPPELITKWLKDCQTVISKLSLIRTAANPSLLLARFRKKLSSILGHANR